MSKTSHFKRKRMALRSKDQNDTECSNVKVMFANGPSMWMTLTADQIPPGSVLAERASVHNDPHEPVMLDDLKPLLQDDIFYTLFNCLMNAYDTERQFIGVDVSNALRAACDALRLDFASVVLQHFATVSEYERCSFDCSGGGAVGHLHFVQGKAFLSFISVSLKTCGLFRYTFGQRLLRLHDVRGKSIDFHFDQNGGFDMHIQSASCRQCYSFVNRTPQHLRAAPAAPSYYDKAQ